MKQNGITQNVQLKPENTEKKKRVRKNQNWHTKPWGGTCQCDTVNRLHEDLLRISCKDRDCQSRFLKQ